MDEWKKLICRGNRCFELGSLEDAQMIYQAALEAAERCLAQCAEERSNCCYLDALAAVAAFVVTRHNLADLHVRVDRLEEAAAHLKAADETLAGIIGDTRVPWTLRAAALRNSGQARQAMLSFADEHGILGPSCAVERRITHVPARQVLH